VLLALCNRIVKGSRTVLPEGSVVKLGSIAKDDLRDCFGRDISFDGVTEAARLKMETRLREMSSELLVVEKTIWQRSHLGTLREHERSLLEERDRLLDALTTHSRGISRLFKPSHSERDGVQLTGLKADLALVEASLDEVRRSLARPSAVQDDEADINELLDRQKELSGGVALLEGFVRDISSHVITRARVVGATSAKAVLWLSQLGQFDVVIIDEASMMPMVMSYLASGMAKERVVVAGDFRQLPPISRHQSESARTLFAQSVFESSGVSQALLEGRELPYVSVLTSHFRSHPEIMEVFNEHFYNRRLVSAYTGPDSQQCDPLNVELLRSRVMVVDTSSLSPEGMYRHSSKWNPVHGVVAGSIVQSLLSSEEKTRATNNSSIGIISPYRAHVEAVQAILRERGLSGIACGTVHRFQGDERRIIIFDLVESPPHRVGPFLSSSAPDDISTRLLNVALSRAREHLIIVANLSHLRERLGDESLSKRILNGLAENGQVVSAERLLVNGTQTSIGAQLFSSDEFYQALVADLIEAQSAVSLCSPSVSSLGATVVSGVMAGVTGLGASAEAVLAIGCGVREETMLRSAGISTKVVDTARCVPGSVVIDEAIVWLGQSSPLAADHGGNLWALRVVSPALASLLQNASSQQGSGARKMPLAAVTSDETISRLAR
jgi:hypothetical protein